MKLQFKKLKIIAICTISIMVMGATCKVDNSEKLQTPDLSVDGSLYVTNADQTMLFAKIDHAISSGVDDSIPTLLVNEKETYQTMDGFGFTLTGGSAMHLFKMTETKRAEILNELFATDAKSIGVSFLRISVGASDLDEFVFSYNDMPLGETDEGLVNFTIAQDQKYLIPILKQILAINPAIKILASPWSPPVWMKDNKASKGGSLLPEFYNVYAQYFVKYIQAMQNEGIAIQALTIQNEPLHPGNNPSMFMPWEQQANFIKSALGPIFKENNIETKIILYDHNADRIDYPINILNDPEANQYVDGSAFHLYGGNINDLSKVHTAHPDKNLYFTEQWVGAGGEFGGDLLWHTKNLIIGGAKNWCKVVLEWNLAADSDLKPYTPGGCTACVGALSIDGDSVIRNVAYYIIAHASKFVRPGAKRIFSDEIDALSSVAFKNVDGSKVLIVLNETELEHAFNIADGTKILKTSIPAKSVGTIVW